MSSGPPIVVFSSLFPSTAQPSAGIFIRERMFRVAKQLPLCVISPQPWFPFQSLIRKYRPGYRLPAQRHEYQDGIEVFRPRFLALPAVFRTLDGLSMGLAALPTLRRLQRAGRMGVLDAHFTYPDGFGATVAAAFLRVPVTITLRGTEVPLSRSMAKRWLMNQALKHADRVIGVSRSLCDLAGALGASTGKLTVIGNGVDTQRFRAVDGSSVRHRFGIPEAATVLITVGGLNERKGQHRVIDLLPALLHDVPELHYLVVGGGGGEGDWGPRLKALAQDLGVADRVHFVGAVPQESLAEYLSAANVFVLATHNEGWANVFLEAMACGLPVVTTNVGGNREVVSDRTLGIVVPFGDSDALRSALLEAIRERWDCAAIAAHAAQNCWDGRVEVLVDLFVTLADEHAHRAGR